MTTAREDFEAWYWLLYFPAPQLRIEKCDLFRRYTDACGGVAGDYVHPDVQVSFESWQAATNRATKIAQKMIAPAIAGAIGGE